MLAAGLHPRVRSQADGSHYTSTDTLPLVPGIDGVGRDPDGRLRYFVLPDTTRGSFADRTAINPRRSIILPRDADPVTIAAAMNPAMSSWVALRRRTAFAPGQDILVVGATGSAGRLAVQIARLLGARNVIAAGRDESRLDELTDTGATATVLLDAHDALGDAAATVDVVLDYVWGQPAADAMAAIAAARPEDCRPLTWVQIGAVAGATAPVVSAALRATDLRIVGSGQGSVPTAHIVAELTDLAAAINAGDLTVDAHPVPLAAVEHAWTLATPQRVVLTL